MVQDRRHSTSSRASVSTILRFRSNPLHHQPNTTCLEPLGTPLPHPGPFVSRHHQDRRRESLSTRSRARITFTAEHCGSSCSSRAQWEVGTKSRCCGCIERGRREVESNGYEKGVKREIGELQDPAGIESCGRN